MESNDLFFKKILPLLGRLKKAEPINSNNNIKELRPSEEMFLIKIDMIKDKSKTVKVLDLVNMLNFAPSTVSTILKALEDNNYIIRNTNPDNKREVDIELTKKGNDRIKLLKKQHYEMIKDLREYLGPEDSEKLLDILEKTANFFEIKKQERETNHDKAN